MNVTRSNIFQRVVFITGKKTIKKVNRMLTSCITLKQFRSVAVENLRTIEKRVKMMRYTPGPYTGGGGGGCTGGPNGI